MKTKKHNVTKHLSRLLLYGIMAVCLAGLFTPVLAAEVHTDTSELVLFGVGSAVLMAAFAVNHYVPVKTRFTFQAAIAQEIWVDYIIRKLFPDNSILTKVFREDDKVLGGAVVHIPQAGAKPTVVKNRSSFPATAVQRTDTDITYPLDVYTTDPTHITNAERMEISYEKIDSVLADHMDSLIEAVTNEMLVIWSGVGAYTGSTGQIIRTTGSDSALNLPHGTATGTRKITTVADIKACMLALNKQNVPKDGRILLMSPEMYGELITDPALVNRDVAKEADYKEGRVARLFGFDIYERSATCLFTNATPPVKKATTAALAATDNNSCLAFHKNALALAMGTVQFFENLQDPQYYGDIYSALVKIGGRQRRTAGEGVISLVQGQ